MIFNLSRFLYSPESEREKLNRQFTAPVADGLEEVLSDMKPEYFSTNPPSEQEAAAREQRRETQERMRQSMTRTMNNILRTRGDDTRPVYAFPNFYGIHLNLLNLSASPDEYRQTYDILAGNNPEQTANLIMSKIHAMQDQAEQYRNHPVQNMSDRDLAENFEQLSKFHTLLSILQFADVLPDVKFTKEQQEEIKAFHAEFAKPVRLAFARAENIADPHYVRFPPEAIYRLDPFAEEEKHTNHDLDENFLRYAEKTVDCLNDLKIDAMKQLKDRYFDGASLDSAQWLNSDGTDVFNLAEAGISLSSDKPLVATFPNGRVQVFAINAYAEKPGLQSDPEILKTAIGAQMDSSLQSLMENLNSADRFVFRGSEEFQKVRESLQNVQNAWKQQKENPSAETWQALSESLAELNMSGADYLTYKIPDGNESHLSGTAQRRVDAIKAIREFAQMKETQMALYEGAVETKRQEAIEAERRKQEAIEAEQRKQEAQRKAEEQKREAQRKAAQEAQRKAAEEQKRLEEQMQPHKERYLEQFRSGMESIKKLGSISGQEQQRNAYKNLNLPNCTEKDGLGKLRNFIVNAPPLFDAQGYPAHDKEDPIMQSVGAIIGFNMILTERLANKDTPVSDNETHPIESLLNTVGPERFAETIVNNPAVQEKMKMVPMMQKRGYEFFFQRGSVGSICEENFARILPSKAEAYARAQVESARKKPDAPEKQQAPAAPKKENGKLLP